MVLCGVSVASLCSFCISHRMFHSKDLYDPLSCHVLFIFCNPLLHRTSSNLHHFHMFRALNSPWRFLHSSPSSPTSLSFFLLIAPSLQSSLTHSSLCLEEYPFLSHLHLLPVFRKYFHFLIDYPVCLVLLGSRWEMTLLYFISILLNHFGWQDLMMLTHHILPQKQQ